MASRTSSPIINRGGYTICEIYDVDEEGNETFVGYGVFSPDGDLLHIASDYESAYAFLDGLAPDDVIEHSNHSNPSM